MGTYSEHEQRLLDQQSGADLDRTAARRQAGTIDLTPRWVGLLPVLLEIAMNGSAKGQTEARVELRRMAEAADFWVEHCKSEQPLDTADLDELQASIDARQDELADRLLVAAEVKSLHDELAQREVEGERLDT